MIKDAMEKNEKATPNGADLEVLKKHFGMCFNSDGSLDLEKLKARLGDQVAISNEGYELKFLGKNYARLLTSLETTTGVVPDKEHNAKPENAKSKNVYISGDNLDALKHLLKSKQGQMKCIYIDPPYNTDSDFRLSARFPACRRFGILASDMLRQSFTDFIFATNTDGSGKAAFCVRARDMQGMRT